jgi:hypothetical protein
MSQSGSNELAPEGAGDMAVIGEGTPNQTAVSFQIVQSIYHELTGRTEDVGKSYSESCQFVLADYEQLHLRISQCCEQYNVKASNCSIKVYYVNDTQETFSSFDRFKLFNAGSSSCVESVLLTYNFLILLPKLNQPQSYTLSVRTASRVSIENQMHDDMTLRIPKILRLMGGRTAVVTVKYVDYVVARNLLNLVDEWLKTVNKAPKNKVWDIVQKRSAYLPLIARYTVGAIVALLILSALPRFLPQGASLLQLAQTLISAFVGLFASYRVAHHLGSAAEDSLDNWNELSFVSLTVGDKKQIEEAGRKNKNSVVMAVMKFGGALIVSVLAKIIIGLLPVP